MSDFLKGNFKTKQPVTVQDKPAETLEDRFEREALRRLGGSIAFVSKRKVMWDAKEAPKDKDSETDGEKDSVKDDAQQPVAAKVANGK